MSGSGTGTPLVAPTTSLQDIINQVRYRLGNYEKPYYWLDTELVFYANTLLDQMYTYLKIKRDSSTTSVCQIALSENTYDYPLASSVDSINSVHLLVKEKLTLDVAPATIWSAGDTITGSSSTVTCEVVEALTTKTYIINQRSGDFTAGEILSNGTYSADQGSSYPTVLPHESKILDKTTLNDIEIEAPEWRAVDSAEPEKYLLDYNSGYISIYPPPDQNYIVTLRAMRRQITALSTTSMSSQTVELNQQYYGDLVNGICGMAYLKRGEYTYDPKAAAIFTGLFNARLRAIKAEIMLSESSKNIFAPNEGFI
jgi:hypothetical protein